jgi:hypothetical protein
MKRTTVDTNSRHRLAVVGLTLLFAGPLPACGGDETDNRSPAVLHVDAAGLNVQVTAAEALAGVPYASVWLQVNRVIGGLPAPAALVELTSATAGDPYLSARIPLSEGDYTLDARAFDSPPVTTPSTREFRNDPFTARQLRARAISDLLPVGRNKKHAVSLALLPLSQPGARLGLQAPLVVDIRAATAPTVGVAGNVTAWIWDDRSTGERGPLSGQWASDCSGDIFAGEVTVPALFFLPVAGSEGIWATTTQWTPAAASVCTVTFTVAEGEAAHTGAAVMPVVAP